MADRTAGVVFKESLVEIWTGVGRIVPTALAPFVVLVGAAAALGSTFMSWTGDSSFPGDLTVAGYPGGNQIITLFAAVVVLLSTLPALKVPGTAWLSPAGPGRALTGLTLGLLAATGYTVIAIAAELGGIANWDPGAWVALVGSLLAVVGAAGLPWTEKPRKAQKALSSWIEILIIAAVVAIGLFLFNYGLTADFAEKFIAFLLAVSFGAWGLFSCGLFGTFSGIVARNRQVTAVAALVAALAWPFTQSTDEYTNLGANILIFAAVALGLNIVVGLAGLLDLGYVAFLGVGAYAAALVSGAAAAKGNLPFPVAVLIGIVTAIVAGVLIGAPTLRLRGDYLAIVTLGFGEIFRVAMQNLKEPTGPNLTNGPEGIYAIPDLNLFGYDFGKPHTILGHQFGHFANYYLLLVFVIAFVAFIFSRVNDSRIGRAWVAIREDETAAAAMGVNAFRFKLLAFALGAALAGLAGTVQAHVTSTVTPDQYQFAGSAPPNSAFLLAAVVLGGMGTISGPLLGAAALYIIPQKLEFAHQYQLLGFGLALILMMRFRPEGIVPSRRRKLEFHEEEVAEAEAQAVADAELAGA
jgi:branched-chain amino acid transport system permease protein